MKIDGLTTAEYRALDAVGQSDLKVAYSSPQYYYETAISKTRERKASTSAQSFGIGCEAFLRWLACDGQLDDLQIIPDSVLSKSGSRAGAAWKEYEAANQGKRLVTKKEHEAQYGAFASAAENVLDHPKSERLVYGEDVEWSTHYRWSEDGFDCDWKAELDIVRPSCDVVVDVKTASDVTPRGFGRAIWEWGYDIQAAHYSDAYYSQYGTFPNYYWVVIKNSGAYECEVYGCPDEICDAGWIRLMERKTWFQRCLSTGIWKSPTHGQVIEAELPAYARRMIES